MADAIARVLVVDDEESVATTIEAILSMDGHDVTAVTTGTEALELIRANRFDVVLTDLKLGDADGIDVLREVQRTSPQTAAIMLTGYASLESAVAALRTGAYDYLMKPSDVEELRATVNRAIERGLLRRRLQELEEVDRLKTQFVSMASHELRTPLTALSGFIQVAHRRLVRAVEDKKGVQEEAVRAADTLALAQRQARRLGKLVDELLDVSRLQLGRVDLHVRDADLVTIAREVVERYAMLDGARAFRLEPEASAVPVRVDVDRIEQVFENLLGNAQKYSGASGTIRMVVRAEGTEARVDVIDEGIGIAPNELENIFNLLYRSPDPRAGHVSGLGLGLYISREIVTRHGGRIWAESTPPGTTFRLSLPLAADAKGPPLTAPEGATRA